MIDAVYVCRFIGLGHLGQHTKYIMWDADGLGIARSRSRPLGLPHRICSSVPFMPVPGSVFEHVVLHPEGLHIQGVYHRSACTRANAALRQWDK